MHTYKHPARGPTGGLVGRPPVLFLENQKKCSDFGKKGPDCFHLWVQFPVQNVVFWVFRRKTSKSLPARRFFLVFLTKYLLKCPSSKKPPPLKNSGGVPALRRYSFCKTLHLKCLTLFWINHCLDNSSFFCTLTLCYVLYQTHSEFWHIESSVYSGIFRHIQAYLHVLRHIHTYWGIIKTYSSLFITLSNPHTFTTSPYSEPWHI